MQPARSLRAATRLAPAMPRLRDAAMLPHRYVNTVQILPLSPLNALFGVFARTLLSPSARLLQLALKRAVRCWPVLRNMAPPCARPLVGVNLLDLSLCCASARLRRGFLFCIAISRPRCLRARRWTYRFGFARFQTTHAVNNIWWNAVVWFHTVGLPVAPTFQPRSHNLSARIQQTFEHLSRLRFCFTRFCRATRQNDANFRCCRFCGCHASRLPFVTRYALPLGL